MGNRSSSVGKQTPNGVNGARATSNGKLSAAENDDGTSTRRTADEVSDQRPSLNLQMYRSFSNTDKSDRVDPKPDFRLLRRSFIVGGHASALDDGCRGSQEPSSSNGENTNNSGNNWPTRTLPRSFGRSHSSASGIQVYEDSEVVLCNRQGAPIKSKRRPVSHYSTMETRSAHKTRPISGLVAIDEDLVEFFDCDAIRRRTAAFQRRFVEHFMTIYSSLPASVQTSALSVAVRRRSSQPVNHVEASPSSSPPTEIVISLHQYVGAAASCTDVPLQLPASEYALTISRDHFDLIQRARVDSFDDFAALARLIVADVAAEAAAELARAFEYQLVLLGDDEGLAARLGAQRAAERAMEYLKRTSRHVDVNSLTRGVVEGRPSDAPATVSAIFGQRYELQWNVDDVFQRPGLRRERLLVAGGVESVGGYGTPWRFYASARGTDATLYGYRAQLLVRDFHSEWLRGGRQPSYRLDADEEAAYDVEVPWRFDDFHRTYRPYRRLVGSAVMASYASLSGEDKPSLSLDQFVQQLQGDAFRRDEVEPVFRPLSSGFGREFDPRVGVDISNAIAKQDIASPTSNGFCLEEFTQRSNSLPHNNTFTHNQSVLSYTENRKNETAPTESSTSKGNSPEHQCAELIHDRIRMDKIPVSSNEPLSFRELGGDVSVSGTNSTNNAHDQNISDANQPPHNTPADELARCCTGGKRRAPPPVVKPKPSLELRQRLSATATTADSSCTTASVPASHRHSSLRDDGHDSTPEVTVRFPTLDELFGHELAAMRQASTNLPQDADNSRPESTLSP